MMEGWKRTKKSMDLSVDCRACGGCNRSSVLHEYAEGTLGRRIFNPERKRGLCGWHQGKRSILKAIEMWR